MVFPWFSQTPWVPAWRQVEASELQKLCDDLTSVALDLEASEDGKSLGKPGENGGFQQETMGIFHDLELGRMILGLMNRDVDGIPSGNLT